MRLALSVSLLQDKDMKKNAIIVILITYDCLLPFRIKH